MRGADLDLLRSAILRDYMAAPLSLTRKLSRRITYIIMGFKDWGIGEPWGEGG